MCARTETHGVGLLQRCLSVSAMPYGETKMSMSQGLSQSNTSINEKQPLSRKIAASREERRWWMTPSYSSLDFTQLTHEKIIAKKSFKEVRME